MRTVALAVGVALLFEAPAYACSLACTPTILPNDAFTQIPANVPGFPFLPARAGGGDDAGLDELKLVDVQGTRVPTARTLTAEGFSLLTPVAPLAPGRYVLQFHRCDPSGPGVLADGRPFEAVEAAPFPNASGELQAKASTAMLNVWTAAAGEQCSINVAAAVVSLSVTPGAFLAPWLPLVSWRVTVDGNPWKGSRRNGVPDPMSLFSFCADAGASIDEGLAPGVHHVVVAPHIFGAPSDPPAMDLDVTLACGPVGPNDGYTPPAATTDPVPTTERAVTTSPDAGMKPTSDPAFGPSDAGCRAATSSDSSSGATGGLGSLLVALAAVRARARATRRAGPPR